MSVARRRRCVRVAVASGVLLSSATTQAVRADDPASNVDLPVVYVLGDAPLPVIGDDPDTLPYARQRLAGDALDGAHADSAVDALQRNLAGVYANGVQGNPYLQDISYRGFRASPTLGAATGLSVYLDGVRINEAFGDIVNWDLLPEAALDSLSLAAGSNPLFGLNTLGGALRFTTRSGLTQRGLRADVSYGSDRRRRAAASYGVASGDGWHALLAGTAYGDDGWRAHSDSELGNLYLKFGRHLAASDWTLSALRARSKLIGNGLLPSTGDDSLYARDRRAVYTYPDRNDNRLTQLSADARHRFGDAMLLSALAYLRNSERRTVNGDVAEDYEEYVEACGAGFDASGAPLGDDCPYTRDEGAALAPGVLNTTRAHQRARGGALNLSGRGGAHRWLLGASVDRSRVDYAQFEQDGAIDASRGVSGDDDAPRELFSGVRGASDSVGLYGRDAWRLAHGTTLSGALRWNHHAIESQIVAPEGVPPDERFTYVRLNPAIGLTQRIAAPLTVYASWQQNHRAPTAIELGCADAERPCRLPTGLQADPRLDQVVSRSTELGARWRPRPGWRVALALYRTRNRDDILFLRAAGTQQGYFANVPRTRHEGVELSVDRDVGALRFSAGYSYLRATYDAATTLASGERSVDVRRGTRIAGLPAQTAKAAIDWRPSSAWQFGGDWIAVSSQPSAGNEDGLIDDDGTRGDWRIGGYALLSVHASWRPRPALTFYVRVDNLLDRRYETFGAVADDLFPAGARVAPHDAPGDAETSRFVAPGAPRQWRAGIDLRFGDPR